MGKDTMPMLFPVEPEEFWKQIRYIIREELTLQKPAKGSSENVTAVPGLNDKPLYKISEICLLFAISRPTVYEWIRDGRLRPVKIRSRVYFLGKEVMGLMDQKEGL